MEVAEAPSLEVALFPAGERRYAIPLDRMRAVIPLDTATPLPLAGAHVVGLVRFQGEILTVFSLCSLLGAQGCGQDPTVLLVVSTEVGGLVALDSVQIPRTGSLPLPAVERARAQGAGPAVAVVDADRMPVHLLDLGRLLAGRTEGVAAAAEARR